MVFFIIYLTALCTGLINWLVRRKKGAPFAEIMLVHQLFFLGIAMVISFYGQVFMSEEIAKQIGWVSNGFQKEIGMVSLGIGVCGLLSVRFRGMFWAPIIIIYSVFTVGSAINHIFEMITLNNFNVLNTLIVLPDLMIPVTMIILGLMVYRKKKAEVVNA